MVCEKIANYFDENVLMTGLTYNGHTVSTQIGNATLDVYKEEKIIENAEEIGQILAKRLDQLCKYDSVGEVRHIGLFAAVELVKDKTTGELVISYGMDYGKAKVGLMKNFVGLLGEHGFYTYSHESSVIIAPPLIISEQEINEAMDIFEKEYLFTDKALISN
ncbi:aminotransferase class III-fold pyridoxal phosphate-dependent enzyme [Niallia sp. 01092]|uniref:aminotransferase class III-fold pyridoxal phosphate-dependent enzyme n=2 Tax=Niallia TaxID=2837506 RepID=UPI003FD3E31A